MITKMEELFIKTFIDTKYVDRLLYEFNSKKKRRYGEDRFAHNTLQIINQKKLIKEDNKLTIDDMLEFASKYSDNKTCFTIVGHYDFVRKETNIKDALRAADCYLGQSVIFVYPNVAIIIEEQFCGQSTRYLLAEIRRKV